MQNTIVLTATPLLDTSAYASGDALHAAAMSFNLSNFKPAGGCILDHILIADKAVQSANLDLLLFSALPADQVANAVVSITDAEAFTIIAGASVTTHLIVKAADNNISFVRGLGIPISLQPNADALIYGLLIARAAATFAAASLKISLGFRAAGPLGP